MMDIEDTRLDYWLAAVEHDGANAAKLRAQAMHPVLFVVWSMWMGSFMVAGLRDGLWYFIPLGLIPAATHFWQWMNSGGPSRNADCIRSVVREIYELKKDMDAAKCSGRLDDYAYKAGLYCERRDVFVRYMLTGRR